MAEVLLRRRSGLILGPADGLAEREIEDFPMGRDLRCKLVRARSTPNLRHYFACLQQLADALGLPRKDPLHDLLKIECGLFTPIRTAAGELRYAPDSIAFDRLEEGPFIEYKRRAFEACERLFGIDPATLSAEGAELLGRDSLDHVSASAPAEGKREPETKEATGASGSRGHSGGRG